MTYGELAVAAGQPRAARAVGNCMAGNRVPLIIPCHRVVRAGGDIGPYSAAGGSATKRRLLEMEAAAHFLPGTISTNAATWARLLKDVTYTSIWQFARCPQMSRLGGASKGCRTSGPRWIG